MFQNLPNVKDLMVPWTETIGMLGEIWRIANMPKAIECLGFVPQNLGQTGHHTVLKGWLENAWDLKAPYGAWLKA